MIMLVPPTPDLATHRRSLGNCPWCNVSLIEKAGGKCEKAQAVVAQGLVHSFCPRCGWCDCWTLTDHVQLRAQNFNANAKEMAQQMLAERKSKKSHKGNRNTEPEAPA